MKNLFKKSFLILLFLSVYSFNSYALEVEAHKAINKYIAQNTLNGFSLDSYLKNNLGLTNGKDEEFTSDKTRKVFEWLELGGEYEDVPAWNIPYEYGLPYLRSVNHFHNPITEGGYTGFWGTGIMSGMSSTQWALLPQNTQSASCYLGCYSWYDVRDYYYKALTSTDSTTRSNYFAKTFRGMGQLMHLIEDASVPAHTRDDGHLFYNYEKWVKKNSGAVTTAASNPIFFTGTISNISSFIDTNQYTTSTPESSLPSGNTFGLAEYTNANFYSEEIVC